MCYFFDVKSSFSPVCQDGGTICPCCGAVGSASLLFTVPYEVIWDLLASEWEARFSEEVVRRHTPARETSLLECGNCGLQFFDPPASGDSDFYRELGESPRYYNPWKWEFDWVMERLSLSLSVLDVGCGRGDFLARIAPLVRRAAGVERNPAAAAAVRARGLEVFERDMADFSLEYAGAFDTACAFHVLEHIAEPKVFLGRILQCLRPGGSLFVSMPNRLRAAREPLEPLDCPPHHLSRWSPVQLRKLGEVAGIKLLEHACEPVDAAVPREFLREKVKRIAGKIPLAGDFFGVWAGRGITRFLFPPFLCAFYRKTGLLERMGYFGLSMAARYVKPGGSDGGS
jgi:SAM-dependent methyltransferase